MDQFFTFVGVAISFGLGFGIGCCLSVELFRLISGKGRAIILTYSKIDRETVD